MPVPPGPVSVSRRVVAEERRRPRSSSRARPTKLVSSGRQVGGRRRGCAGGGKSCRQAVDHELDEALGPVEVLEPVLAEVAQARRPSGSGLDERAGRLATTGPGRRGRPPRSGPPDGRRGRRSCRRPACLAGVEAHPDADAAPSAAMARPRGHAGRRPRPRRPPGAREDDEERVALGRDLDAAVARRRLAKDRLVALEERPPAGPSACASRVEPSMSVNRKVTVPVGRADRSGTRPSCVGPRSLSSRGPGSAWPNRGVLDSRGPGRHRQIPTGVAVAGRGTATGRKNASLLHDVGCLFWPTSASR